MQKSLFEDVLKNSRLTGAEEKEVYKSIETALKKINSELKKKKIKAKAVLGGSAAKKTFLKGDFDCDIFVKFNYSYAKESSKLSDYLEKALKNAERLHGSRDYFRIKDKSINFEIIPVLDIKDTKKALNVTDASPMHVYWVLKHINKNKKLRDDILLTKLFCKANRIYGAESYIKGFSGHVIDILTIYYKGFEKLLKNASKWKDKVVIDIENYHKGKALENLNTSKTYSPLVLVDPMQPERNAAASVSAEKFDLFRKRAAEFIKKPSKEFFIRKKLTTDELRKKAGSESLSILTLGALKGKEDVIGGKLLKCFEYFSLKIKENGFGVLDEGWSWDKGREAILWFVTKKETLSDFFIKQGPPLSQKDHAERFTEKNKNTFTENKRLYAKVKREHRTIDTLIKSLAKESYVKERAVSIKLILIK